MIIALLVIDLIVVGIVTSSARTSDLSLRQLDTTEAFYAAEAGMNMAIREVVLDTDQDGDCTAGSVSHDGNDNNDPVLSHARFIATVSESGSEKTVTSYAWAGASRRQIFTVFTLHTPGVVTFDAYTPDTSTADRASATFNHTVGSGTDPCLVVIVVSRGDQGASGVTYNSVAMVPQVSEQASTASNNEWVQIYTLAGCSTGTNSVDVTFNNTAGPNGVFALSYFGVDQTNPVGNTAGNNDTNSVTTLTVDITTTVADSVVVGGLGHHGGDTSPHDQGGDVTDERFDTESGTSSFNDSAFAGGEIATTSVGTYTFEWTNSVADDYAIACIELKPSP